MAHFYSIRYSLLLVLAPCFAFFSSNNVVKPIKFRSEAADSNAVKWVRMNIHFINRDNGTGNFNPNDDGNGNPNMNGYKRAELLVNKANQFLANNQRSWRPSGNKIPVLPTRIQYLLTGVYFHNSTVLARTYTGGCSPDIYELHKAYSVNTSSEINFYYTRSESDAYIKNETRCIPLEGNGVGDTNMGAGISSVYGKYLEYPNFIEMPANLMNHEMGHIFSLAHTWNQDDGCDDTPRGLIIEGVESQCFNWKEDALSPCNNWVNVSNNVMDYNNWQAAYTPCQIEKIHEYLNGFGKQYVQPTNGCPPVHAFFDLSGCFKAGTKTSDALYLNGEASVNEFQYKIEICEVSNLENPTCLGGSYTSGWLNGQVGKLDLKSMYPFSAGKFYKVELSVGTKTCSDVSKCTKYFQIGSGKC